MLRWKSSLKPAAAAPPAGITLEDSAVTSGASYSSPTDIDVNIPAVSANDILLLFCTTNDSSSPTDSPPSGWTKIVEKDGASSSHSTVAAYWKRASLSASATTETWSAFFSSSEAYYIWVGAYSGCITGSSPVDAYGTSAVGFSSSWSVDVTTTVSDTMIVTISGSTQSSVTQTWTDGTELIDTAYAGVAAVSINEKIEATTGSKTRTVTPSITTSNSMAAVALKPAAAAALPTVNSSLISGTNANSAYATSTTASFAHAGGLLVIFSSYRNGASTEAAATCTFNGVALTLRVSESWGDASGGYNGAYCFTGEFAAQTADIVVDLDGESRNRRSISAVSINGAFRGSEFVKASGNLPATYNASDSITTAADDLVLAYHAWRNSAASATVGVDQTVIHTDDSPSRLELSKKRAVGSSTTVSSEISSSTGNDNILISVAIKPAASGGGGYASEVLADSPLAYWPLNESSGSTAFDQIGSNDLTYVNTPTLGVTGLIAGEADTAVSFDDASSEYAEITGGLTYPTAFPFTLEILMSSSTETGNDYLISIVDNSKSNVQYGVKVKATTTGAAAIFKMNTSYTEAVGTTDVLTGGVFHIVAVFVDNDTAKLYVNGSEEADLTTSITMSSGVDRLSLARAGDSTPGFHFDGTLQHAAIYDFELSTARISAHAAAAGL